MSQNKRPVTLITGASAGIGAALAREFAANGHELVLIARREQILAELADSIAAGGHARPVVLPIDLERTEVAEVISTHLILLGLEPEIVVNNAGFGLLGTAASLNRAEQLAMIDVNVRTLTDLSLAFVDSLERHKGGILNVASVAGFLPGPEMAVYYATKAYVLSFSEALHYELKPRGVRVTALCPGPVATGFQARAKMRATTYPLLARSAEEVAREGYRAFKQGRRVVVPGFANKLVTTLTRFVPHSILLKAIETHQADHRR